MNRNSNCTKCGLCNSAEWVCMKGVGERSSKIMIIAESPGPIEDIVGEPLQGKPGKLFWEIMGSLGITQDDCYVTHAVKCRTPEGRPPTAKEMKACKGYLEQEMKKISPKYVLLLGSTALKQALGKAKITEIHGTVTEKDGVKYFPSFSPAMALRDPKKLGPIQLDLAEFARIVNNRKTINKHRLNWNLIDDLDKLKECVTDLSRSKVVGFDIETTGLDRYAEDAAVTLFTVGTPEAEYGIPLSHPESPFQDKKLQLKILEIVKGTLDNIVEHNKAEIIAHNGKFDNLYLQEQYGLKMPLTFDTIIASHLLDENRSHKLKYLARILLGAPDWDIDVDKKKGATSLLQLGTYGAWDVHFTIKLRNLFLKQLKQDETLLTLFRELSMPVALAYEEIESNGVYLDETKRKAAEEDISKRQKKALAKLTKQFDINWSSQAQVTEVLFDELELKPYGKTPKGKPSTSEDNLLHMKGQHPIIEDLLELRGLNQMNSFFVEGWKRRMRGQYLYPSFKTTGTVTGRPSCEDPNIQQTARDKQIRSQVGAPAGWEFFEADYSQIELRIAAMLAGEQHMLRIFRTGGDIHKTTATAVTGIPEDELTSEERKKAKAVNFGFLYGMGWKKFKEYAFTKYNVNLNDRECKEFRRRFFELYPDLPKWHDRQRRVVHALQQVRTLTGRIRHLPEVMSPDQDLIAQAERNAINSPVQGFAAELTLMSIVEIQRRLSRRHIVISGTVHDAIIGRVNKKGMNQTLKEVKEMMESPELLDILGIELTIPIEVEVKVGNWGEGKTLNFT